MILDKPTEPRVGAPSEWDYDIAERVTRALQDSPLSVARTMVFSSIPDHMRVGGHPADWDCCSIAIDCTLVTDARRGWLVLVEDPVEFDAEKELTGLFAELLEDGVRGRDFVVRACDRVRPRPTGAAIDMRRTEDLRERLEAEYERAFADAGPVDHQRLIDACLTSGYGFSAEPEIRAECIQTDDFVARRESRAPSRNRAERRSSADHARRRRGTRRRRR